MAFVRQNLFKFKTKLLMALLVLFSISGTMLVVAHQVMADSEVGFYFERDGESPNSYGENAISDLEYRYIYDFYVYSDEANIDRVEYEIDGGGRQSIDANDGAYDSTYEHVVFYLDQIPYADFNPHNITFYATTVNEEEVSQNFNLEPYPDPSSPVFYFDMATEGDVESTMMPYTFSVTDDFIQEISVNIDGQPYEIYPYSSGADFAYFDFDLSNTSPPIDEVDGEEHTITFFASDPYGNEREEQFSFRYVGDGGGGGGEDDVTPPNLGFDIAPEGNVKKPLIYEGTAQDDDSEIYLVYYTVDGGDVRYVNYEDDSTDYFKHFTADLSDLSDGTHDVTFYALDIYSNYSEQSFSIDLDSVSPSCTASWYNQEIPYYSKNLSYANITCTDDRTIVDAQYNVYHVVQGDLQLWEDHHVTPQDGNADSNSETFDFDVDLSEFDDIDGVILIGFRAIDQAGNQSFDYDPVTLEATDNTNPTINLDQVTPDPLTDPSPTITGSCRDNTERETNTFISSMRYKVDDDGYTTITLPDDGEYDDSYVESFSVDLPVLSNGTHTVTVECTDGASHSSTAEDTFTIQDPESPMPGEFTYTENFESVENQDIPNSNNVVWGNGKLRLKEDLTTTRTAVNTTNACGRYDECRGLASVWQDPVDANKLWYYQNGRIYTYNTSTSTNTWFDYTTEYGIPQMGGDLNGFALGVFEGKEYLWMSDIYSLSVINLTDHTSFTTYAHSDIGSITLDFSRARLAAYMVTTSGIGGSSNMAYYDLNGTMDQGDDVFTVIPLSALDSDGFLSILIDPENNAVYSGSYANDLFKWNDNNNPADYENYQVTRYSDGNYSSVFGGMILDPENRLIFGTANNSNGRIFVISDDGGTPFDSSDDTVTQLATPQQLGYNNIYRIQYVTGLNGVGDQLLLETEANDPIYFNFNSTYDNLTDDTFISLPTRNGIRPGRVSPLLKDYNTMYVEIRNQGFFKVDLTRGWKDSGDAVALPTRPPQQLVVDNFVAEASVGGPIAYLEGNESNSFLSQLGRMIVPQAQAAGEDGIHYYVSTDGGVTWTEVTLGQLQQLQQTDYRVKFRIALEEVGGATPVLNSYSLAYAGYPDESGVVTTTGLHVSPSTTNTTTAATFNLTVEAVDVLGFKTPGYNGPANLTLIDNGTGLETTGLNVSSVNLTSGSGSLSGVQINKVGAFKIRATDGEFTADSPVITVTSGASLPSPSLGFSASSFKIKKGETVTLHWTSSNLTSFVLNPGNNQLSAPTGDFYVHPTETTTYTLTGTGPYGSTASSLEIVVEGELSSGTGSSPTPTPGASVSPAPSGLSDGSPTGVSLFAILGASDQTIVRGQKAEVSWNVGDADEVTVDYPELHTVSPNGSFEFFPTETTVVTITAKRGDEVIQKKITITVLDAPIEVQQLARSIQERLPWSTPFISAVIQGARSLPRIGLGIAALLETGVVGLLIATVISQVGLLAALNGRTFLNILSAAGILPSKQRKGFVHQARNGEPIPFAAITVYEGLNQRGNLLVTLVSDMFGVYLEPFLPKGQYNLVAAHSTSTFPTKLQRPSHLSFKDFYKGEVLGVISNKEHPALLIPMDAMSASASKHALKYRLLLGLNRLLNMLQWTIYPLALISLLALWLSPNIFNAAIVFIYAVLLIRRLLQLFKRPVMKGRVIMEPDRRPVANATLTLTTNDGGVVAVSKSDAKGNFEFFAPKGNYVLNVVSSSLLWKDVKAGTLYTIKAGTPASQNLTLTMAKIDNPFGGF